MVEPMEPFLKGVAERLSQEVRSFDREIVPYAEYALSGQGKQLRPVLVALSGDAAGGVKDDHVTLAVIIEMVHLATLVHDDVMDEAAIRRGRATLAENWGNEIAVLLGDCLFAHALKLAAGFPTTEICRAVALSTNTVCSGEILQTQRRHNFDVSRVEYFKIVGMKTAELFALSCDLGAMLARAPQPTRQHLREFGTALGTAYQIYDDCVDIFGSEFRAGKSLGTDLAKGKLTLPMLVLWERADSKIRNEVRSLICQWDPKCVPRILELLRHFNALEESRSVVLGYLKTARENLEQVPASSSRDTLLHLSRYLSQQTDLLGVVT